MKILGVFFFGCCKVLVIATPMTFNECHTQSEFIKTPPLAFLKKWCLKYRSLYFILFYVYFKKKKILVYFLKIKRRNLFFLFSFIIFFPIFFFLHFLRLKIPKKRVFFLECVTNPIRPPSFFFNEKCCLYMCALVVWHST